MAYIIKNSMEAGFSPPSVFICIGYVEKKSHSMGSPILKPILKLFNSDGF